MIRRGLTARQRAEVLAARGTPVGKCFLQASIVAQHARAERAEDTDWRRIAALYDVPARDASGPGVEVNRLAVLEILDVGVLGDSPLVRACEETWSNAPDWTRSRARRSPEAAARTRNDSERAVLRA